MAKDIPAFEIIGSKEKAVAIVEIPKELKKKKLAIAKLIMKKNKSVKSVLEKISERKGKARTREYKLLTGDKNTEVIHKEYGYLLKADPQKVYFSPREATERQRIAEQVKPRETVLVMFSGIAPIPIAIAKKQPRVKKIYAIEINQKAVEYAKENIRINKLSHLITTINSDVKKIPKNSLEKFDRVVMPLPLEAYKYLDVAVSCLKKGGSIHFYSIGEEKNLFNPAIELIDQKLNKLKKRYEIINKRFVLPYAPKKWKICIDFKVK